jgi:ABC-type branched-subunit amino acid transport system substrate-binding protein
MEALAAYLGWRTRLVAGAAAAYAESRAFALAGTMGSAAVGEVKAKLDGQPRACLDVMQGAALPDDAAEWVVRCRAPARRIGVLLPRTGPLSALADVQLAAAVAAAEVLAADEPGMGELIWHDSGSDAKTAADGAAALVAEGASVIVGPIGADNVRAVTKRLGRSAAIHVPGESVGEASGSAPSLEARVAALVDVALANKAERLIVLVPDNGYGKRVTAAAKARASARQSSVQVVVYPPNTTSFAPVLDPIVAGLGAKVGVLIGDQIQRTGLVVRQLARDGKGPGGSGKTKGPVVLATAEGISDVEAKAGHDVLAGIWVAPAAAPTADTRRFTDAYVRAQGEPPSDQALLVFRALQSAAAGGAAKAAAVHVARVEGGRLVVQAPPSG